MREIAEMTPAGRPDLATDGNPAWRIPYRPLLRNAKLQAFLGHNLPLRMDQRRHATKTLRIGTEPGTTVEARLDERPAGERDGQRPIVVIIHGVTACHATPYMIGSARSALAAGFDALRLNVRNCGGTEHLTPTLYHAGMTADLRAVTEQLAPRPVLLLGFSMGANMALKLAGEWGADAPSHVLAVCGVSAPLRLDLCSQALGERRNADYETFFLHHIRSMLRRKCRLMPDRYSLDAIPDAAHLWEFDEQFTAPTFGFENAADYYRQASSASHLDRIRVPTLLIQARDDPIIPFHCFAEESLRENPAIRVLDEPHGGHVAFLARGRPLFWAPRQAMRYFRQFL